MGARKIEETGIVRPVAFWICAVRCAASKEVSTDIEKVVVNADVLHAEHVFPDSDEECLFGIGSGRMFFLFGR